ncbi:MAG TPA: FtsW/RodA/SpoVE family cell cycle protein, partial [Limnochordales bacterium]
MTGAVALAAREPAVHRLARRWLAGLDGAILASTGLLVAVGVAMVYSTTRSWAPYPTLYLGRHLLNLAVALPVFVAAVAVDYRRILRAAPLLYAAGLASLAGVLAVGRRVAGTQGWFAVGSFSLQPSELAKVLLIITLAAYLAEARPLRRPRDLVAPVALAGAYTALVLLQPDLGTSAVFGAILLGMLFVAQAPGRYLAWMVGLAGAAVAAGVLSTWAGWLRIFKPHQLLRLMVFVDPKAHGLGAGWNVV